MDKTKIIKSCIERICSIKETEKRIPLAANFSEIVMAAQERIPYITTDEVNRHLIRLVDSGEVKKVAMTMLEDLYTILR